MADSIAAAVTAAPSPLRAPVPAAPEVLSLFAPASSLSPIRIFVSLCVLLVFLLIAFFSPPKKNARNRGAKVAVSAAGGGGKKKSAKTVLLVGPLAAGKTALFSKLAYGHVQPTHTSMKENETVITHKWNGVDKHELADEKSDSAELDPPLHLVDIPGHPRLRTRSLAQYLPAADGIVFTIDGAAGLTGKNVRDAAEHLHVLLSLLALQSTRQPDLPPLLILLTKSDMSGSSSLANASGGTASPSSSSSSSKARSPTLALERAKQSLLRELERRRLASTGAGGGAPGTPAAAGSAPLSAGAKLEGLEAIPSSSSSSNGAQGLIRSFLSLFGLGNSSSSSSTSSGIATLSEPIATSSMTGLPSDENEILSTAAEDVFAFEGSADWDKLANAVGGVEIQWKVASVVDGVGERRADGVGGVYEWVQDL
ncbi:hypothetical protein RHOSPDRAFT_31835 [Rhodotorula sp. JG-1b]|nr:hypothetical protein RHOSPDRAFT_31835 [Rhodotorula sp. JG-1b]